MSDTKNITKTFDERYASAIEPLNHSAQLLAQYRLIYESTNDNSIPLAVLCTAVDSASDAESVALPVWAARLLAAGFAKYLDAVASGSRTTSLEQCLGIGTEKSDIGDLTTLDEMATRVHWFRWQFGLKVGEACHVVHSLHIDQCEALGLIPDKVGITRTETTFKQYYERECSKQYAAWQTECEAQGKTPTIESRELALGLLPTHLANRVRRRAKIII